MAEVKHSAQIKHLREKYTRFGMDFRPEVLEAFRAACAANDTTPTTEIKRFVQEYIDSHPL